MCIQRILSFTVVISIALITTNVFAQQQRPKIGVVLSGGGARGFAHVGVLKWFEEHRIPVDMIAGTSMGGLVGGMYATGMTSAELEQMIERIDWADLFRSLPRYETLSFRRKEDRRQFPNNLEFGLKGGWKVPPGVNPGHTIGLFLNRYTLAYSSNMSFDDLPIRFRCIATDMVNAKQVILESGSLSTALQATMAIPGVFYPVEIDGQTLASDGGLLNNVPTDVAELMGADIIIAVDIGTPLGDRKALDTLGGVLNQTISVAMEQNIRNNLNQELHPKLKVAIKPDLKEFTSFDFENSNEIIGLGYEGAQRKESELLAYQLSEQEWAEHLQNRRSRLKNTEQLPVPESIGVTGTSEESQNAIAKSLESHMGQKVNPDSLDKDLSLIWGRGRYAGLSYQLTEIEGRNELIIRAREKGYAPPFLNVGLEINNTQTDVFDFNLRARVTLMDLRQQGAEWRLEGSLGSEILAYVEYYKLIGDTNFFVAPQAFYRRSKTGVFFEQDQLGEYQLTTAALAIDLGYSLNSSNEIRLGYAFGRKDGEVRVGVPDLPEGGGKFSEMNLRWVHDSADSAIVPTRGVRSFSYLVYSFDSPIIDEFESEEDFAQASVRATTFFPFGTKNTLFLSGEGGTTFENTAPVISKLRLGGLLRVSSASRDEFRGDHILFGSIGYLRKLATLPFFVGDKISAGLWYEVGSAFDDRDDADYHHSISGAVIAETFLGPIFLGLSFGDEGRNNFFFALGKVF